jgi:glycosyltransferase involved in cell wall biosynthesis
MQNVPHNFRGCLSRREHPACTATSSRLRTLNQGMAMPKVTVIIATYNCSHTLKCALASVRDQTYKDFEVWVVGDCCTDDSEQVVAAFNDSRFNWTNLSHRVGTQSGPNNEGLKRARGEFIAYLGHDDLWFPWHLETLVTKIEQANADFVHGVVVLLRPDHPAEGSGAPESRRTLAHRWIAPSTWLHRRTIVEACGPWPLPGALIEGVDSAFQRRVYLAGFRFAGTGQLTVIKFPSQFWRLYAQSSRHPQQGNLEKMQRSPGDLQTSLLTQMVVAAIQHRESRNIRPALRAFLAAVYWRVIDLYGMDRWPLSTYFRVKRRRYEQRARSLRGLPASNAKSAPAEYRTDNI